MSSSFIHVVACVRISFLLRLHNILSYACTRFCLFISGHLSCFHLLAVVNNSAINMGVHIFLHDSAPSSSGYMLRVGTAGLYSIFIFNFLRNYHTVFHSSNTILHHQQQCTGVSISPYFCQHL